MIFTPQCSNAFRPPCLISCKRIRITAVSMVGILLLLRLPVWCQIPQVLEPSDDLATGFNTANVKSVTANGAYRVTKVVGSQSILHFVTPKGGSNSVVTLTATLTKTLSSSDLQQHVKWEGMGVTQDANNPLQATVSKSSANRFIIKIKIGGKVKKELRVWVVWAVGATDPPDGPVEGPVTLRDPIPIDRHNPPQALKMGTEIQSRWRFKFTIFPTSIVDGSDPNCPDFTGQPVPPPAGISILYGLPLSGGVSQDSKWDVSRRLRIRALAPNVGNEWYDGSPGALFSYFPVANSILEDYPADPVKGNDDVGVNDEVNTPTQGQIISWDNPRLPPVRDDGGQVGDTIEIRMQFQEFARLEIEGKWYVVSDPVPWRHHVKLIKADEAADNQDYNNNGNRTDKLWIDNGSEAEPDNAFW